LISEPIKPEQKIFKMIVKKKEITDFVSYYILGLKEPLGG
jgi:hypothetical protein